MLYFVCGSITITHCNVCIQYKFLFTIVFLFYIIVPVPSMISKLHAYIVVNWYSSYYNIGESVCVYVCIYWLACNAKVDIKNFA